MRARDGPLVLGPFHAWVGKGLSFVPHPIQVINVEDPHRWTWVPSVSANPYTPPPHPGGLPGRVLGSTLLFSGI